MRRRQFLRLGGTSVAGLALAGAMPASSLMRSPSARVGYANAWDGAIVDAASFPQGASDFGEGGSRVTIFGLLPEQADWRGRASLDVLFPQAGWQAPFLAWSHDGGSTMGRPIAGGRSSSFVVPLDDAGRLLLEPSWNGVAFPVSLTTGSQSGLPKLMVGYYALSAAGSPPVTFAVDVARQTRRSLEPRRIANG